MPQPQQTLSSWLLNYISAQRHVKSRYEIDRSLIEAGYDPARIEAVWQFLSKNQTSLSPRLKRQINYQLLLIIAICLGFIGFIVMALGPQVGMVIYSNYNEVVSQAKIGDRAIIPIKQEDNLLCQAKSNQPAECVWRSEKDAVGGVVLRFSKHENLYPAIKGGHYEVKVISRQDNLLIVEVEDRRSGALS